MNPRSAIVMTEKQLRLIEKLGVFYEKGGMQPAAARILALLLVSDNTELTFEEIYELLHLSKSATSNALNSLLNTERVEYITQPGERRRYFRFKMRSLKEGVQKSLEGITAYNVLLKEVLELRPENTGEFNASLEENSHFLDFIKDELPRLFQKWEASKG
jgi:DNA-binding transcriptional regulator GbsR (MarR family)